MGVVSHQVVCNRGGLSSGWFVIGVVSRVVCNRGGFSSGWFVMGVVSHQGGL